MDTSLSPRLDNQIATDTMDAREKQILPPKSWETFEDLCHQLFKAVWCDPYAQKNGRQGQKQHGVDIYGSPGAVYNNYHGVQCKKKNNPFSNTQVLTELKLEIAKAETFEPALHHWIFATTAPVDAIVQQKAREISVARKEAGTFAVSVLGWSEIVVLLCKHNQVLSNFYPEHRFDTSELLSSMQNMLSSVEFQELLDTVSHMSSLPRPAPIWFPVNFGDGRDLGPALLGRSLGPEDAAACPRLREVNMVVNELKQAYSARIVGEPGAGKSVCAYQTAIHFADNGWSVFRLSDPSVKTIELEIPDGQPGALFIIDDAHLTSNAAIRAAEEAAGPRRLLLSTHNAVKHDTSSHGAVTIDAKLAVRTIASALLSEPERTLDVVRRIDKSVGSLSPDFSIERRIEQAEQDSQVPWQFCFILGGGWRRAKNAATAARFANADIALAGIAIRQLASRDARSNLLEVVSLLRVTGLTTTQIETSVKWLIQDRFVIGPHDLRCPHQRFASAVLTKILEGQDHVGRERISLMMRYVVADAGFPIAGLRLLMQALQIASDTPQWTALISEESLAPLIERCWQASTAEERTFASLTLSEIRWYVDGWPRNQFESHIHTIGRWISDPDEPSGYGLAWLIHDVHNKDEKFARTLVEAADPHSLATAVSAVTPKTANNLGALLCALHVDPNITWGRAFVKNLNRSKLVDLAINWPETETAWAFTNFCCGVVRTNEELALDMIEGFIPSAQKLLSEDPISAFRDMFKIAFVVLRVLDILGVFVGKLAPKTQHRELARKMLKTVKASDLAQKLSTSCLRDFQSASHLLYFMARATPSKFRSTVTKMDWTHIANTIGDEWKSLPHHAEVLLGVASHARICQEKIASVIHENLNRIESFPPRLVVIAPSAAYEHIERGGLIRIAGDWQISTAAVACFAKDRPGLLQAVLKPSEIAFGGRFSEAHPSFDKYAADYICLLEEVAPSSLQRILDAVNVRGAEKGWTASLRSGKSPRRTVALLVKSSLGRQDEVGELARRLRVRFPKSSDPSRL